MLLLYDKQGSVEAAMPLYMPRQGYVIMPAYTQTMGPWIATASTDSKYTSLLGKKQAILGKLATQLSHLHVFRQNFAWTMTDWLPFYWQGFEQTNRYTYLLNRLRPPSLNSENLSKTIRRKTLTA